MICSTTPDPDPVRVWSLSPSGVGRPLLLSEPNRNYPYAASPRVGLGVGGRTLLGDISWRACPGQAPPLRLPGARAPPTVVLCPCFFSFKNPGTGVDWMSPDKGAPNGEERTSSQESFIVIAITITTVRKQERENQTIKTTGGLIYLPCPQNLF